MLIVLAALAVVAAPAGAKLSNRAYFRLDVKAFQNVEWSAKETIQSCSKSIVSVESQGDGSVIARDHNAPWAVAQRSGGRATLLVHNEGPAFAAEGDVSRHGTVNATYIRPPDDPKQCPQPIPHDSDCGTILLPGGALMYTSYLMPASWTYPGPKPKVPMLTLSGPYVQEWGGMPFKFCPGANGDDTLAGSWYDPNAAPMGAPLPLSKLFGKAKHFSVSYSDVRTVQTGHARGAVLSDDHPVTTTIHWTVKFTRIKPQLGAPEL